MNVQLHRLIALTALTALISGCSNSGIGNSVPAATNAAATALSLGREPRERVKIREFSDLPSYPSYYFPTAVAEGPDSALWVTDDIDQDAGESAVARIDPSGKRTKTFYFQNSVSPSFSDITDGPDGALWLVDGGDGLIQRLTTKGQFTTFPISGFGLQRIAAGPDGALWFTENAYKSAAIGRITANGKITNYTTGISSGAIVEDIAPGPDGALWFTESTGDRIGRITTSGAITEFTKGITPSSEPYSIAAGPDGALWFTEMAGGRIGRITTKGKVKEYSHGITASEEPNDLAAGSDAMWFTEYEPSSSYSIHDSKIGRITTSGKITEYAGFDASSKPTAIARGPGGKMWFVETATNRLGRVSP